MDKLPFQVQRCFTMVVPLQLCKFWYFAVTTQLKSNTSQWPNSTFSLNVDLISVKRKVKVMMSSDEPAFQARWPILLNAFFCHG